MRPLVVAIAASLAAGCLTPSRAGLCSGEDRRRCLGVEECATDRTRGCVVCACRSWDDTSPVTPAGAYPEGERPGPPLPAPGTR
ncbi:MULTISPECIES: hypothetical protein [Anaeromyxobacter]|jgi:hypothetical protein|uniref:hypothetical protein n=1 Tax=Anaeromyxobacter TaxID=161492 RepID=UPI001F570C21|nr:MULTISPECIES: hypothetical protein [unclassified Anaeromyxobacter]